MWSTAAYVLVATAALAEALSPDHVALFTSRGVNVTMDGEHYVFESHGIPDHDHGPFPSQHNPNEVTAQDHRFMIPQTPTEADPPGCLTMGAIGVATNGVVFFNPYTAEGYNAVEGEYKETFDDCDGHPQMHGTYHYHQIPSCLFTDERDQVIGVAFDGYLIYGPKDGNGDILTSADLDFCHGRVVDGVYRYYATHDFPYLLGCFHGNTPEENRQGGPRPPNGKDGKPPPPNGGGKPPPPNGGNRPPPPNGGGPGGPRTPSDHDGCYANYSQPQPQTLAGTGGATLTLLSTYMFLIVTALTLINN